MKSVTITFHLVDGSTIVLQREVSEYPILQHATERDFAEWVRKLGSTPIWRDGNRFELICPSQFKTITWSYEQ